MKVHSHRHGPVSLALAGLLAAALSGCGDDAPTPAPSPAVETPTARSAPPGEPGAPPAQRPWSHLVGHLPDALGPWRATDEAGENRATVYGLPLASAERKYAEGERGATVRLIDTEDAPSLRDSFAVAHQLSFETHDDLARPMTLEGQPMTLQWSRDSLASNATLLVGGRFLVSIEVWPADGPEDALALAQAFDLEGLLRD